MTSDLRAMLDGHGLVKALHDHACTERTTHGDTCAAISKSGRTPYDAAEEVRAYLAPLLAEPAAEDVPAPAADGGEVHDFAEEIRRGVEAHGNRLNAWQGIDAARAVLASDWLADLRRTERAEGAREAAKRIESAIEALDLGRRSPQSVRNACLNLARAAAGAGQ